jgi:hypothetical protein
VKQVHDWTTNTICMLAYRNFVYLNFVPHGTEGCAYVMIVSFRPSVCPNRHWARSTDVRQYATRSGLSPLQHSVLHFVRYRDPSFVFTLTMAFCYAATLLTLLAAAAAYPVDAFSLRRSCAPRPTHRMTFALKSTSSKTKEEGPSVYERLGIEEDDLALGVDANEILAYIGT